LTHRRHRYITVHSGYVCFTPKSRQTGEGSTCPLCAKSRQTHCNKQAPVFDNLVGAGEQRRWHSESERLGGLEVNDQHKLGWLLDWKITRPLTAEDAIDVRGCLPILVGAIIAVSD
jgi:hypothetical protein